MKIGPGAAHVLREAVLALLVAELVHVAVAGDLVAGRRDRAHEVEVARPQELGPHHADQRHPAEQQHYP